MSFNYIRSRSKEFISDENKCYEATLNLKKKTDCAQFAWKSEPQLYLVDLMAYVLDLAPISAISKYH